MAVVFRAHDPSLDREPLEILADDFLFDFDNLLGVSETLANAKA